MKPAETDLWSWAHWIVAPEPVRRNDRFRPVEILGALNRDRFLAVLNGDRELPQRTFQLRPRSILGNTIRLRSAVVSTSAQLRLYVDERLDTGVDGQGVEDPRARDLARAPNACAAVH